MLPQEFIRLKRDGQVLPNEAIDAFVAGITDGSVTDAHIAAFAMTVIFNDLNEAERIALTRAMMHSGRVLDWSGMPGPVLDKHSTGGVGDKVSLILAPLIAACGGCAAMLSGRGLGHTGGTLDKLDTIPGYQSQPAMDKFKAVVKSAGCAVIGQTDDLAPADRRFYSVRDVTATVESEALIVASILSKKLATAPDAMVLDVKYGSGAFLPSPGAARSLARALVRVANGAGLPTTALLTDMNQVLGQTAGNALEVRETIAVLTGGGNAGDPRLLEVTLALVAAMLVQGKLAADTTAGRAMAEAALADGRAAERFARMVVALGGPTDLLERSDQHLAQAPVTRPVLADQPGYVSAIDVRGLGVAVIELGGGRRAVADTINPAVGLAELAGLGTTVGPGATPLCVIHAANDDDADRVSALVKQHITIADAAPAPAPIVGDLVDATTP